MKRPPTAGQWQRRTGSTRSPQGPKDPRPTCTPQRQKHAGSQNEARWVDAAYRGESERENIGHNDEQHLATDKVQGEEAEQDTHEAGQNKERQDVRHDKRVAREMLGLPGGAEHPPDSRKQAPGDDEQDKKEELQVQPDSAQPQALSERRLTAAMREPERSRQDC